MIVDRKTLIDDPSSVMHGDTHISCIRGLPEDVLDMVAKHCHVFFSDDFWSFMKGRTLLTSSRASMVEAKARGIEYVEHKHSVLQEHPTLHSESSDWGYYTLRNGSDSTLMHGGKPIKNIQSVYNIQPKNREQHFALDALLNPDVKLVCLTGKAGTGKTLMALCAGMYSVIERSFFKRLIVSRPVISMGNDIGFLPGTLEEKMEPWMKPIYDNLDVIHKNADSRMKGRSGIDELVHHGFIEVEALTYIRGRSLNNHFVIIDEAQNLTRHQVKTIVTRAGSNTKIILTGDPYQIDSPSLSKTNNGLISVVRALHGQSIFRHVHFEKCERSKLAELGASYL